MNPGKKDHGKKEQISSKLFQIGTSKFEIFGKEFLSIGIVTQLNKNNRHNN